MFDGVSRRTVFLNKFDLLEKKLEAGVKVNRFLPSFAERENSAPILARCAYTAFLLSDPRR